MKISFESIEQIGALGCVMKEQNDSMILQSVEDLEWEIKQLYGGMAAEEIIYGKSGHITGGADDIKKATAILQHFVIGNAVYTDAKLNYKLLGEQTNKIEELEEKSQYFYDETMHIIHGHKELLIYLSSILLREWSLSKDEIFEFIYDFTE